MYARDGKVCTPTEGPIRAKRVHTRQIDVPSRRPDERTDPGSRIDGQGPAPDNATPESVGSRKDRRTSSGGERARQQESTPTRDNATRDNCSRPRGNRPILDSRRPQDVVVAGASSDRQRARVARRRQGASLRSAPTSAGLTALTSPPRALVQTGSCRRCPILTPYMLRSTNCGESGVFE